jgi:hypothetical protein
MIYIKGRIKKLKLKTRKEGKKMAKLSARGRKEVVRMKYIRAGIDGISELALMSDGTVLTKLTWKYEGKIESTGWKVRGKIKGWRDMTFNEAVEASRKWIEHQEKAGYVKS